MSASEKLKALGERTVADRYQTIDQLREKYGGDWPAESSKGESLLLAVLPQIVAVVEAAERVDARKDEEAWRFRPARMRDLRRALAALEEALT